MIGKSETGGTIGLWKMNNYTKLGTNLNVFRGIECVDHISLEGECAPTGKDDEFEESEVGYGGAANSVPFSRGRSGKRQAIIAGG